MASRKKERLVKSSCKGANLGSHLSIEEAANRLECSRRTIHNYMTRGYLTKSYRNGKVLLRSDEVEQLAISSGVGLPAMNRQSFFLLTSKVRRLEEIVGVLQRALDVRDSPLRPNKADAQALYAAATSSLKRGSWVVEEMEKWSTVFDRFDEVTLDLLAEHVVSTTAYEPLFKLCLEQMRDLSTKKDFHTNLDLQLLHKKLDVGRKVMRDTILMWLNIRGGSLPEAVLGKLESDKGALFQRLAVGGRGSRANKAIPLG